MTNLASTLKNLMDLIGQECIYKERGLVLHAQLRGVSIKADMLELQFEHLPSPGFSNRTIHTFTCSSIREYINFRSNRICSSLIGLEVFFHPPEVQQLVEFMATMPEGQSFIRKLREYRNVSYGELTPSHERHQRSRYL